jgi:sulfotransferase
MSTCAWKQATVENRKGTIVSTQFHLISGLPRSGSTLLSALLRQNPRFSAAITSPVAALIGSVHKQMCGGEFGGFFDDAKRETVMRAVFESYYADRLATMPTNGVVFDTNRTWTGRTALLAALYPQSRIICCVRDIGWVIDSIESMLAKNPLQLSRVFNFQPGTSVYSRVETLMNSDSGLIGLAWSNLREAWFGEHAQRLILVPYEHLVKEPARTLQRLYAELGEAHFEHDLHNVVYDEPDYDLHIGMPGLHAVRKVVEYRERKPCIPPDIFAKYASSHFWTKPELNTRGVTII